MYIVSNPATIATTAAFGVRISANQFLYLPLEREARNELMRVGKDADTASWMTPYGDIVQLEEPDFGIYNLVLNNEPVGTRLRADDIVKLVHTIETGRAFIAARQFKRLPGRNEIESPIRIGLVFKEPDTGTYTLLSLGRLQPTHVVDLKKYGWTVSSSYKIQTKESIIELTAHNGLGVSPVLLNGDAATVSDVAAELEDAGITAYELRDLR